MRRRSSRSASARSGTSSPPSCSARACRCCSAATRSAAPSGGNNNGYAQDNEISWFDWELQRRDRQLLAFTRSLIRLFKAHPVLRRRRFFQGRQIRGSRVKDLTWFAPDGTEMTDEQWQAPGVKTLAVQFAGDAIDERGPARRADHRRHPARHPQRRRAAGGVHPAEPRGRQALGDRVRHRPSRRSPRRTASTMAVRPTASPSARWSACGACRASGASAATECPAGQAAGCRRATYRVQLHAGFTFDDAAAAGPVPRRARHQPPVHQPRAPGGARLHARLRRGRSLPRSATSWAARAASRG